QHANLTDAKIVVHPTRTYTIERSDGSIVKLTCRRTQKWLDASRAHEKQHEVNDRAEVSRLNSKYGGWFFADEASCRRAVRNWRQDFNAYSAAEGDHS